MKEPVRDHLQVEVHARRCVHGFFPRWCVLESCPHWDGRGERKPHARRRRVQRSGTAA